MTTPFYQDDYVTLYHGDCLDPDLVAIWGGADVLVTDPPYGINYQPRGTYHPTSGKTDPSSLDQVANDQTLDVRDDVLEFWGDKPAILFGSWRQAPPQGVRHRLIWHKQGMPPGPARAAFMTQDEEIYVLGEGLVATSPPMRSVLTTTEHRSMHVQSVGHPTPKPLPLMSQLIDRCPEAWQVADPFAGSGSTLVAAKQLGRKAIGIELEEKYCEIAANRCSEVMVLPMREPEPVVEDLRLS